MRVISYIATHHTDIMKHTLLSLILFSSFSLFASADEESLARGKKLYDTPGLCTTCHQPTGAGLPGAFPPLTKSEWVEGPISNLVKIVKYGLTGEILVAGVKYNSVMTPALNLGKPLTDQEIADVLTYVRMTFSEKKDTVTLEQVQEILKDSEVTGMLKVSDLEKPTE